MSLEFYSPIKSSEILTSQDVELFERFQSSETKIAIQKDGELTDISRFLLEQTLGVEVPSRASGSRKLVDVSGDGQFGFVYAKNKGICSLVGKGAVDLAVVGIDRVIEDDAEDTVDIVEDYQEKYNWPIVVATPLNSKIQDLGQIKRVATQYPKITDRFINRFGLEDIEVIPTAGGTELYPYVNYGGDIDGIVDMSITGSSLKANGLVAWTPAITEVYPVLIRRREDA